MGPLWKTLRLRGSSQRLGIWAWASESRVQGSGMDLREDDASRRRV